MRLPTFLMVVPVALSLAACGGGGDGGSTEITTPTETSTSVGSASSAQPTASTTPTPTGSASAPSAALPGQPTQLIGTLGTPEDPNAFEIGLTKADGTPVQELPAGTYQITVQDEAVIHNWHLTGEGVDEQTGVAETESPVFEVELVSGETYTYFCDPHTGSMSEEFSVL